MFSYEIKNKTSDLQSIQPSVVFTPALGGSLVLIMITFFSTFFGLFLFIAAIFMIFNDSRTLQPIQSTVLDTTKNYSCSKSYYSRIPDRAKTICSDKYFVKYKYNFTNKDYEKNTSIDQATWTFLKIGDPLLVYVDTNQPDYNTLTKESPFKNIAIIGSIILLSLSVGSIFGLSLINKKKKTV